MSTIRRYSGLEVAVIGMSGRFPGAEDINSFWNNLLAGEESITFFTEDEMVDAGIDPELLAKPNYVKAKGVFPKLEYFDAQFFNYTPRDAATLDPQVRALHEEVYHALEDAGYASEERRATTGLFLGSTNNFAWELATMQHALETGKHTFATIQLNDKDFAATRIAYSLNLHGPSISVSSACSTSLYAIDLACRQLMTGACSLAIAGGSGLSMPSQNGYIYEEGSIRSPDGHCRPFDQDAKGTVEGNGVGIVVLKRLNEAIRDRDHIYSVILGTAANNDGNRKVGYTAPSVEGQAEVIRRALKMADVSADSIHYVETHGTGTKLGDLVEIAGLTQSFRDVAAQSCGIGSLKSNIGHLDSAAGVASFIKASLALKHEVIPASVNYKKANSEIGLTESPFRVIHETEPMYRKPVADISEGDVYLPLRAGVSSFGIGGTNVHIVLEEAPDCTPSGPGREWKLFCLSALNDAALDRLKNKYITYLNEAISEAGRIPDPSDLAWTLQSRQKELPKRFTMAYRSLNELADGLMEATNDVASQQGRYSTAPTGKAEVYYMFPGQGAQYPGMAQQLYSTEKVFRNAIESCLNIIEAEGIDELRSLLLSDIEGAGERLQETLLAQLSLFSVEYSLAKLLMSWGIKPSGMIGHSLGEITAACIAEVFSLEEGLKLVIERGRLMQAMARGAMLSVSVSDSEIEPLLTEELSLAAVNTASQCTVSGSERAIDALEKQLSERGIHYRRLRTSHAFHSYFMDDAVEPFIKATNQIELKAPKIPYLSNVTGDWITADEATDATYYGKQLRGCVQFNAGLDKIAGNERAVLIEVGPGNALSGFAIQSAPMQSQRIVSMLGHAKDSKEVTKSLVERLGILWGCGVSINWKAYYQDQVRNRIPLPLYPFEETVFPIETVAFNPLATAEAAATVSTIVEKKDSNSNETQMANQPVGHLVWESSFLPIQDRLLEKSRTLLIFTDQEEEMSLLINKLPRWRSLLVRNGDFYHYEGTLGATVRFNRPLDIRRLFISLRRQALLPNTIVVAYKSVDKTVQAMQSIVHSAHAELKQDMPEIMALEHLSVNDQTFGLVALMQGLRAETGLNTISVIDAGASLTDKDAINKWANILKLELSTSGYRSPAVAYVAGRRMVPRFTSMPLPEAAILAPLNNERITLISHESHLDETIAFSTQLNRDWKARVNIIPYRLTSPSISSTQWQAAKSKLHAVQEQYIKENSIPDLTEVKKLVDQYATCLAYDFVNTQFSLAVNRKFTRNEMLEGLAVIPSLSRYVDYFLHLFEREGIVLHHVDDDSYIVSSNLLTKLNRTDQRQDIENITSLFSGQLHLLEHCVKHFSSALRGDIPQLSVLYPGGRNDLLLNTHKGSLQEQEDNFVINIVSDMLSQLATGKRKLRILEVGGGYGSILRKGAPLLKGLEVEYYFTDVSNTLISQFEQYAVEEEFDFIKFGLFDITKSPEEQGLSSESFDCVLAYNVVHATHSLSSSLSHLQQLLKPDGMLCIAERTSVCAHVNLIWGLADGWWHFDQSERSVSPLISREEWERHFAAIGLDDIDCYPKQPKLRQLMDIGVIIGRKSSQSIHKEKLEASHDDISILPLVDALTPEELEYAIQNIFASSNPSNVILWDALFTNVKRFRALVPSNEEAVQLATVMNQIVVNHANKYNLPAFIISTTSNEWEAKHTQWVVMHDQLDKASQTYRIYAVKQENELAEHIPSVMQSMLESNIRKVTINAEGHPFLTIKSPNRSTNIQSAMPDDVIELERLLRKIWGNLFGRENVALDADFFELGGDSFKLIQMTVDLEKLGYKVMMNEVYRYPTIRQLARYLKEKTLEYNTEIANFATLEKHLQEQLGLECIIRLTLGENPLTILFAKAETPIQFGAIRQQLREMNIQQELLPHIIAPLSLLKQLPATIRLSDLVKTEVLSEEEISSIQMKRLKDERLSFERAVLGQPVTKHYGLSNIQKAHFRGEVRLQIYLIEFNEMIDIELLEQAFCDIIGSHSLLRSCLDSRFKRFRWQEHAAPQQTILPKLDLSGLTPEAQMKVMSKLAREEWDADFKISGKLMYHVMLIKLNEQKYNLFFQFDHSIFDVSSGQSMRRMLLKRYRDLQNGVRTAMELSTSYDEYVKQISLGPIGVNADQLIEMFDLKAYGEARKTMDERLKALPSGRIQQIRFNMDISSYQFDQQDQDGTFYIGMVLSILVMSRMLNIDAVPFDLLFQNRRYQGKNFSDVMGLVLDGVSLVVPVNRENPSQMIDVVKEKIQYMNKYNINFMNMVWNLPSWLKWRKIGKAKKGNAKKFYSAFLMNYAGNAEAEYDQIWDYSLAQLDDEDQSKFDYGDFYVLFKVVNNALEFLILCKFEPDMKRIETLFYEELDRLSGNRKVEAQDSGGRLNASV